MGVRGILGDDRFKIIAVERLAGLKANVSIHLAHGPCCIRSMDGATLLVK